MADEAAGIGVLADIGARLRARRLELGLGLDEVQAVTRIALRYLEAIEEGRGADLPVDIFVRGYLRTYGNLLGMDGPSLSALYGSAADRETASGVPAGGDLGASDGRDGAADGLNGPRDGADHGPDVPAIWRRRRGAVESGSPFGMPVGLGGSPLGPRRSARGPRRQRGGQVSSHSAESIWTLALLVAAAIGVLVIIGPHGGHPPATTGRATAGAGQGTAGATTAPSGSPGTAGTGGPAKPPGGKAPGALTLVAGTPPDMVAYTVYTPSPISLKAAAVGRCWIGVTADGAVVRQQTLTAGQTASFQATRSIVVIVGNPPGLAMTVDGKHLPPVASNHPLTFRFTEASAVAASGQARTGPTPTPTPRTTRPATTTRPTAPARTTAAAGAVATKPAATTKPAAVARPAATAGAVTTKPGATAKPAATTYAASTPLRPA